MARTLSGDIHPVQALETPPLLISISKQYTQEPPARDLYADLEEVLRWPGILSASVAMGFYFADVNEMGASFLAVADGDCDLAGRAARWMAQRAWNRRDQFAGELAATSEAVRRAAESERGPVVLMDIGDNVGGGSPGDSTILFEEIVRQHVGNALVVLYDPASVAACVAAGVSREIELTVGAKTDKLHGSPVPVKGRIRLISDGLFVETQIRHGGWGLNDQGITAVVETAEHHTIVLTSLRMAPMSLEQILSLGIKPERKNIFIVKGVVAPRAAYEPVASEIILVNTPGSTSADPANFHYTRRRRPLYPLEKEATYPPV
jgi:microcystin degradation protein MlrC